MHRQVIFHVTILPLLMAERYYEAFKKSYSKLTDALPINDLLPVLFQEGVVPSNLKEKVNSISVRSEKVTFLLDKIEPGLKIGIIDQFESFVCVLEKFGTDNNDIVVKKLAEDIRSTISGVTVKQSSSVHHQTSTNSPGKYTKNKITVVHQSFTIP